MKPVVYKIMGITGLIIFFFYTFQFFILHSVSGVYLRWSIGFFMTPISFLCFGFEKLKINMLSDISFWILIVALASLLLSFDSYALFLFSCSLAFASMGLIAISIYLRKTT